MRLHRLVLALLAFAFAAMLIPSCTQLELCNEDEHPHRGRTVFRMQWDNYGGIAPDTAMYVLANRVIKLWKASIRVDSQGTGAYIFPKSLIDTMFIDMPGIDFKMPIGDYKFYAFSYDPLALDYTAVENYVSNDDVPIQDISVKYRLYEQSDNALKLIIPNWTDYNVYRGAKTYMQPNLGTLCFDTVTWFITNRRTNYIPVTPRRITQVIDFYFDIKKNVSDSVKFTIDSVFCEMSGIPTELNLSTGYFDIQSTGKTMFQADFTKDTDSNKVVNCHAQIDVPTIVHNTNDSTYFGPGIMQVVIFTSATHFNKISGKDETLRKYFQGKINLYNTLTRAKMYNYADDGRHVYRNGEHKDLHINADIQINGDKIIESSDDVSGLDRWIAVKEAIVIDL